MKAAISGIQHCAVGCNEVQQWEYDIMEFYCSTIPDLICVCSIRNENVILQSLFTFLPSQKHYTLKESIFLSNASSDTHMPVEELF